MSGGRCSWLSGGSAGWLTSDSGSWTRGVSSRCLTDGTGSWSNTEVVGSVVQCSRSSWLSGSYSIVVGRVVE